ncbi:hypothetical protein CsSME_00027274 [Camellia sinensis var. sinensis]
MSPRAHSGHFEDYCFGTAQSSPQYYSAASKDMSSRAHSGHFEDYCFGTAQSSPQYYSAASKPESYPESLTYEYSFFPNYMANTKSSIAKVWSQRLLTPKSRPDSFGGF